MPVSLKIAKKRKIQAPPAAFAEPEDEAVPELTDEERNKQVQKLKVQLRLAQRHSIQRSVSILFIVECHYRIKDFKRLRRRTIQPQSGCGMRLSY